MPSTHSRGPGDTMPPGFWLTAWRFGIGVSASLPLTAYFLLEAARMRGDPLWPSGTAVVLMVTAVCLVPAGWAIRRKAIATSPDDKAQALSWKAVLGRFALIALGAAGVS